MQLRSWLSKLTTGCSWLLECTFHPHNSSPPHTPLQQRLPIRGANSCTGKWEPGCIRADLRIRPKICSGLRDRALSFFCLSSKSPLLPIEARIASGDRHNASPSSKDSVPSLMLPWMANSRAIPLGEELHLNLDITGTSRKQRRGKEGKCSAHQRAHSSLRS